MNRDETNERLYADACRAWAAGDRPAARAAFDVLHFRHQDRIRWRLHRNLPPYAVEDVAQEVFIALWVAIEAGQAVDKVAGWLNKVAANHVADFHRGRQGRAHKAGLEGVALDDERDDAPARELSSDPGYDAVDTQVVVDEQLAALGDAHRAIVQGYVFEGRGAKDVAAATGESESNVYKVAQRFRDELRAALSGGGDDVQTRTGLER